MFVSLLSCNFRRSSCAAVFVGNHCTHVYLPLTAHSGAHLRQRCGTPAGAETCCNACFRSVVKCQESTSADRNPELGLCCTVRRLSNSAGQFFLAWRCYRARCERWSSHGHMTGSDCVLCVCRDCAHYVTLFALLFDCRSTVYYINTDVWLPVW